MSDFDERLRALLSEGDDAAIEQSLGEKNVLVETLGALKGPESGWNIMIWITVMIFCGLLFFCIYKFFHVETVKMQIFYAAGAVLCNSAQIAFKLWFHMRLNRHKLLREIRRLQLAIVHKDAIDSA